MGEMPTLPRRSAIYRIDWLLEPLKRNLDPLGNGAAAPAASDNVPISNHVAVIVPHKARTTTRWYLHWAEAEA